MLEPLQDGLRWLAQDIRILKRSLQKEERDVERYRNDDKQQACDRSGFHPMLDPLFPLIQKTPDRSGANYMGPVGIEPTRVFSPEDFKSPASACSATAPQRIFYA